MSFPSLFVPLVVLALFVIVRDDVDDGAYVAYAQQEAFESFCHFRDGGCTLVAPEWALTARHVARSLAAGDAVYVGGDSARVRDLVLYPERATRTPDLALVRLDRAVAAVEPARPLRQAPAPDTRIHLIGRGDTGTGLTGPTVWDKITRGATNLIDEVTPLHLRFGFDPPGSARTTDLEGISGPGDSGGPAYVLDDGGVWLAGVSSAQDQRGLGRPGVYGVAELYVNVASFTDWIDGTLAGRRFVVAVDGADEYAAWLDGEDIVSVEKNGAALPAPAHAAVRDLLLARAEAEQVRETGVAPGDRMPLFIDAVFALAHEAGVTDAVRPVNFSITETELVIEGVTMSREVLERALARYRELFGKGLAGGFKLEID